MPTKTEVMACSRERKARMGKEKRKLRGMRRVSEGVQGKLCYTCTAHVDDGVEEAGNEAEQAGDGTTDGGEDRGDGRADNSHVDRFKVV